MGSIWKKLVFPLLVVIAVTALMAGIYELNQFGYHSRHSSTNACINNLRNLDGAIQQWVLENKVSSNAIVTWSDLVPYVGRGSSGILPHCPDGGIYTIGKLTDPPRCSIM